MQFGGEVMRQVKVTRYVRGVMIFVNKLTFFPVDSRND
jgi:hypothetical protein